MQLPLWFIYNNDLAKIGFLENLIFPMYALPLHQKLCDFATFKEKGLNLMTLQHSDCTLNKGLKNNERI